MVFVLYAEDLVEACRVLGVRLVAAWARWPDQRPVIPADEDEELHARRLVAQRCLYGVDRNPRAVDLARRSLWLATLARDHEFTFLDHALKCGDSLVGLTDAQIQAEDWPDLIAIVRRRVKPDRDRQKNEQLRVRWWQFARGPPALYSAIRPLQHVLAVNCGASLHAAFAVLDSNTVFGHTLTIIALSSNAAGSAVAHSRTLGAILFIVDEG